MMPEFQVLDGPAFSLFQRVKSNYNHEDFHAVEDEGIVIGVVYSPLGVIRLQSPGWIYYVFWLTSPSSPLIKLPVVEEALQEDLVATEASRGTSVQQQECESYE